MKRYTFLEGYKVGFYRCPECFRGLKDDKFCMIHGEIEKPITIHNSEARATAIEIRENNGTEKITYEEYLLGLDKEELVQMIIDYKTELEAMNDFHKDMMDSMYQEGDMQRAWEEGYDKGRYGE